MLKKWGKKNVCFIRLEILPIDPSSTTLLSCHFTLEQLFCYFVDVVVPALFDVDVADSPAQNDGNG